MGTYKNLKYAQEMASRLGERSQFDSKLRGLPDRKIDGFISSYILAGGFYCNNRNGTQERYYRELRKY